MMEKSIKELSEDIASSSPTPGGGTVAALAGNFAASLMSMVSGLTLKSNKYEEFHPVMKDLLQWLEETRSRLLKLSEEDTEAYNQVVLAFRMPKETEEEKMERQKAIQKAFKRAAEVPLETAEICSDILEKLEENQEKINLSAYSDWEVAREMSLAALKGALYNVEINMESIKDGEYVDATEEQLQKIKHKRGIVN